MASANQQDGGIVPGTVSVLDAWDSDPNAELARLCAEDMRALAVVIGPRVEVALLPRDKGPRPDADLGAQVGCPQRQETRGGSYRPPRWRPPTTVNNQPSKPLSCHTHKSPDSPGGFIV